MANDYKSTLNLPRTDFPMKADLVAREPERLKKWEAAKLYQKIQTSRVTAEKFVLHDGPPFANGDVHIGTALNKILKDIIIKYKTLRGKSAPYIPGWDCHGLPIEFKVTQDIHKHLKAIPTPSISEQEIKGVIQSEKKPSIEQATAAITHIAKKSDEGQMVKILGALGAPAIRKACEKYAWEFINKQRDQFKRLGVLGDWENPYLTLNKEYEADELRLFADIVAKGFVYRGKKPVYWSIPCRTALAEAEVEYHDHVSQSVFVKFPVVGRKKTFVVIWTTTPWTLPANLAVAFNPNFQHSLIKVGDEKFIVSDRHLIQIATQCGLSEFQNEKPLSAEELASVEYQHPFCSRTGRLFPATFVDDSTGTGFVHIAPGHGLEDYQLGLSVGLPIYSPVDDDGKFAYTNDLPIEKQMPKEMIGKSILEKHGDGKSEANEIVLAELRHRNVLLSQEKYPHSYPFCWRSKTPVIFRAMDQWFIKIDHVLPEWKKQSLEHSASFQKTQMFDSLEIDAPVDGSFRRFALFNVIYGVEWIPDWGKNRIYGAIESRPDWCISRQRTWGVPIPAFYDAKGEPMLDAQIVRNAADLIEQHGSNIWFEKSASELWALVKPANWTGAEAVVKSNDTLDVWIDSGSSSRAVLMRRGELQHKVGQASSLPGERVSASVQMNEPTTSAWAGWKPAQRWQADVYLEGSDQHRGWFQSSLLLSLAGNGAAPFKTVLTHGFMVDADREKISKSKQGGYEKPQTAEAYVKKYGADVVRLWVASQDYRSDIVVSEERINKVGETYRGIRNALRYQLSNLYDFDPATQTVADDQLTGLDRWILGEFAKLEAEVIAAYDQYEFHVVYQKLSQFIAVELSSVYHDVIKDRLYTDAANSPRRRSTQTALHRLVTGLCQMLAPILAFTADEAWEFIPGKPTGSVHESEFMPGNFEFSENEKTVWKFLFKFRDLTLSELEKARRAKKIGKSLEAKVRFGISPDLDILPALSLNKEGFKELLNVSSFEVSDSVACDAEDITYESEDDNSVELKIEVTHADGQKCERCWHWETDIGQNAEHPTICGRCVAAVL